MNTKPVVTSQAATIHSIQLLRAVAAALVAMFHAHQAFAAQVTRTWFVGEEYVFGFGAVGVHVFFVISGFIMVVTSWRSGNYNIGAFLRRRLVRIYPIYWVCALLYLLVHVAIDQPYRLSSGELAGALTLWPGAASGIIGPAWTLGFEVYFYGCFGLAMVFGLNRGLIALGLTFAVSIVIGAVWRPETGLAHVVTNTLLLEFLAGCGIGWLTVRGRLPRRSGAMLVGLAAISFISGLIAGYDRAPSALIWGVPSSILVLGLVAWEKQCGAAALVRLSGRFGDSSYVLYLVHTLLITLAVKAALSISGSASLAPITAGFVLAATTLVIAHGMHILIERPLLRRLSRGSVPPRQPLANEAR